MKRIYLVKKDEHLPTSQDNWIEMNALQFAAFLETDAGQRRRNRFLQLERRNLKQWKIQIEESY